MPQDDPTHRRHSRDDPRASGRLHRAALLAIVISLCPALATAAESASISLFTTRNRGLFPRGDAVAIFWCVRNAAAQPATAATVSLAGDGLRVDIGSIALPDRTAGGTISGLLTLDTAALAPGTYDVSATLAGARCFPLRFRLVQREPLSDYEIYSHVYGEAEPHAGSPIRSYHGGLPNARGLAPVLPDVDASLDPSLAAQTGDPAGPAPEKFLHPSSDEARLMALAALGMRAVLPYPTMLYHEDWNPKHSLPEELAQMRRRLALFVQPLADIPGFGGITMGWYATTDGNHWEDVPCQDGNVAQRNATAQEWVKQQVEMAVRQAQEGRAPAEDVAALKPFAEIRARSQILSNAWAAYLADVRQMAPALTAHNAIPSWWLGGASSYAPYAYGTLTQRDAVCYSDYGLTAWGGFRTPAWMGMGNRDGQRLLCNFFAHRLHNRIVTAFAAAGRGLDGFSMPCDGAIPDGADLALRRIFERFGPWFTTMSPLTDVAIYNTDTNPQNVAMHDLARMRRPAMLLGPEDVLAGELAKYRVLFLISAKKPLHSSILEAFASFASRGGIIVKDRTCLASLPGRDLGFGYEGAQVHPVWGLAYADGESEFAHLWRNFKATREQFLIEAFSRIPGIPVTTSDPDAVISPLAGKESIICFVVNQTLAPLSLEGHWRQHFVLPKSGELVVEDGWHVRNLLTGAAAPMAKTASGRTTSIDFTRAEGAIYLLTRQEPANMAMRAQRLGPTSLRLTGWLADAAQRPLADPMPFEVTLLGQDGSVLFRKYAALGPEQALDVPVPAMASGTRMELVVRDLILGSTARQTLDPAPPAAVHAAQTPDLVGGVGPMLAFMRDRKGPVTVLLDGGQESYRPAAERVVALLARQGRQARIVEWDPAAALPLPSRWRPTDEDREVVAALSGGRAFARRVGLKAVDKRDPKTGKTHIDFEHPDCGYGEYGPWLRHDADIVLFGTPADHRVIALLSPYLRREPTPSYPSAGGFFIHYLWSPFQGGYDGLYVGCRDAAGAEAAVATLAGLQPALSGTPAGAAAPAPALVTPGTPGRPENLVTGGFGRAIEDIAFAPDGTRAFALAGGLGRQLFALAPDGRMEGAHALHHRRGQYYQGARGPLSASDARTVDLAIGETRYRFNLDRGFVSRWEPPGPRPDAGAVRTALPTVLPDRQRAVSYAGGRRWLRASDGSDRCLWTYDDESGAQRDDELLYPRTLFPRAISLDGRVLLVTGFGSREMAIGKPQPANPLVMGLDCATGKVLWRKNLLLNAGGVVALDDRFLIVPDDLARQPDQRTKARLVMAATGAEGDAPPLRSSALISYLPARKEILCLENDAFDRDGPTARITVLTLAGAARQLPVSGRVIDHLAMTDGQSVILSTSHGETVHLAVADGRVLWRAGTPSGGILRLAPDSRTVWVGSRDGVLHRIDAATGESLGSTDLNPYNTTTPESFVQQMDAVGALAVAGGSRLAQPLAIDASYRSTLDPKRVPLGRNLIADARYAAADQPGPGRPGEMTAILTDAKFTCQVEAGNTYLVEVLAAMADPAKSTALTRLEIAISGTRRSANLPYVGRLPLADSPARRRLAFRADESGEVALTLRAIDMPAPNADSRAGPPALSPAGLMVSQLFVGAIGFKGPNLLRAQGADSEQKPIGDVECTVFPWTGGSSLVRNAPWVCMSSSSRMVNGLLAGENSAWEPAPTGRDINHATAVVRFKKPQTLTSIAVYEDNTGPDIAGAAVREKVAPRYGIFVRRAGARDLTYVGHVSGNTQLLNIFTCPAFPVQEIHYYWAGRNDSAAIDGPVRMAEIEAYADETAALDEMR